jgi:hypothetical protein
MQKTQNLRNCPMNSGRFMAKSGQCQRIKPSRSHEEAVIEELREDPDFAGAYLHGVLEDGNHKEVLTAIRCLAASVNAIAALNLAMSATTRASSPAGSQKRQSAVEVASIQLDPFDPFDIWRASTENSQGVTR